MCTAVTSLRATFNRHEQKLDKIDYRLIKADRVNYSDKACNDTKSNTKMFFMPSDMNSICGSVQQVN